MAKANGQQSLARFKATGPEKILLRQRQHGFTLFLPIVGVTLISFLSMVIVLAAAIIFPSQIILFAILALVILAVTSSELAKIIVDWYFHFYILTGHRILEVSYRPFFSDKINNVILNQVKSTEIDIESNGIISKILDMGNVTVTFDRPTHQEEFVFANMKNPRAIGFLLCDALDTTKPEIQIKEPKVTWFKQRKKDEEEENSSHFRFTEEIFPGSFGAI